MPTTQTGYFRASVRAEQLEPRLVLSGTFGLAPAELPDSITEEQGALYAPTEGLDALLLREAQSENYQINESELDTFFSELTEKNTLNRVRPNGAERGCGLLRSLGGAAAPPNPPRGISGGLPPP